jgi:hypothetical protein
MPNSWLKNAAKAKGARLSQQKLGGASLHEHRLGIKGKSDKHSKGKCSNSTTADSIDLNRGIPSAAEKKGRSAVSRKKFLFTPYHFA